MTTQPPTTGVSSTQSQSKKVDWSAVIPKSVDSEDALGSAKVASIWEKMYREAGLANASEDERRALRAAVYVYCALNGTSRVGDYASEMVLSTGKTIPAAIIPQCTSRMHIRKFLRGNMIESYKFLKESRVMESHDRFIAKCAALQIAPEAAFATADWLADCPLFTPQELAAHSKTFTRGIDRSRRARDGMTLEGVEERADQENLRAQGPAVARGAQIDF